MVFDSFLNMKNIKLKRVTENERNLKNHGKSKISAGAGFFGQAV